MMESLICITNLLLWQLLLLRVENWLGSGMSAVIFVLPLSAWKQEEAKHGYHTITLDYCVIIVEE